MPKLIKDGVLTQNEWQWLVTDEAAPSAEALETGKWIVPFSVYLTLKSEGLGNAKNLGVWLASADNVQDLAPHLKDLNIVGLNFEKFADGRSFSQARIIREQLDFGGEIRVNGDFYQDQMFYLARSGVNAFLIEDDANSESMIESLSDFSDSYQAACDEPQPLFRRRV